MNKPLELFYYKIHHKLFLLPHVVDTLIVDVIHVIKQWLFYIETRRVCYPPDKDTFDKHCFDNGDFMVYIDSQGIVYKYNKQTQTMYQLFARMIHSSFDLSTITMSMNTNDILIITYITTHNDQSFGVMVDLPWSQMKEDYLIINLSNKKCCGPFDMQYESGLKPIVYQLNT